ncbi:MAG: hotdog domain-containing protein [Ilumatobacteraceae bacterium]
MGAEVGMRGIATMVVGDDDTSIAMRSGEVAVLATPRIVALCEEATCTALTGRLQPGCTSVGMRVQIDHLHPTAIGQSVEAEAILDKIEGRRLVFTVSASDAKGLVAAGKVTRVVVDLDKFIAKTE